MTQPDPLRLRKIERALISVSDKTFVVEFARVLTEFNVEIISTGGTAKTLRESGIAVTDISDVTGFPEMMDGRVKTLHPRVHGGLLALRDNPQHVAAMEQHNIKAIDMVVVNLYPFAETIRREGVTRSEAIEQIDIGGPAMIRSAAKNAIDVAVVVSPSRYEEIAAELRENHGALPQATRERLAVEAFRLTAVYDVMVSAYLADGLERASSVGASGGGIAAVAGGFPTTPAGSREDFSIDTFHGSLPTQKSWTISKLMDLRYGENPHQIAALYQTALQGGLANAEVLSGKEMSFNNYIDAEAAFELVCEFTELLAQLSNIQIPPELALDQLAGTLISER